MNKILKNANILQPDGTYKKRNIWIEDGKISQLNETLDTTYEITDLNGMIVLPSIIDHHTHVFNNKTTLGVHPDLLGYYEGVPIVVDAGSAGSDDIDYLIKQCETAQTQVYYHINYSKVGLTTQTGELSDICNEDDDMLVEKIKNYPDLIKGIKLRMSHSVVGDRGITPLLNAKKIAQTINMPLIVHIGNYPPQLEDVISVLSQDDVVAHPLHGKVGGIVAQDKIKPCVYDALKRGVVLDVAHGSASFSFNVAKTAALSGCLPTIISTDFHRRNYKTKVTSLSEVMTKMMACGMTLEDVLLAVSYTPAKHLGIYQLIEVGEDASFSVVAKKEGITSLLVDSEHVTMQVDSEIEIKGYYEKGQYISKWEDCMTPSFIESIVTLRTQAWTYVSPEIIENIVLLAQDVLACIKQYGLMFEENAGMIFVSHIATLYDRIHMDSQVEVEAELLSQVEDDLMALAQTVASKIETTLDATLSVGEVFLLATHIGVLQLHHIERGNKHG